MTTKVGKEIYSFVDKELEKEYVFKGYYLPKGLDEDISKIIDDVKGIKIELLDLEEKDVLRIIETLKTNQADLEDRTLEDIVNPISRVLENWSVDSTYSKKERIMKILPEITGHSREQLDFYSLGTFESIDLEMVKDLLELMDSAEIGKEIFEEFIPFGEVKLKGYASFKEKLKLGIKDILGEVYEEKQPTLITNITPSNVTGLLEVGSVLYSALAKSATIVKTPSKQPIFGPAFLESLEEEDPELASTIAILNWPGGDESIEDIVYNQSDIVNVIGDNETIKSVKDKIEKLEGIRGTYHGAKFGLTIVGKEYPNSHINLKDLAKLVIIDAVGHEGYACHSPAFGVFVEGDDSRAKALAKELKGQAEIIDDLIPQGKTFQSLRDKLSLGMLVDSKMSDKEVYMSEFTLVEYCPSLEFNPICRNRAIRVIPVSKIDDILTGLQEFQQRYKENMLQTVGIAVSNERLEVVADSLGKIGFTNLRALGGINFPKAGETWDGKIPIREFKLEDTIRYISIPLDIDNELNKNLDRVTRYGN